MRLALCKILLLAVLLIACPLPAQEPVVPISFKGIYEFTMLGFTLGRVGFEVEQSAQHYAIASDFQLSGLAKLFMQYKGYATVKASGAEFKYPNIEYESRYQKKKKERRVKLITQSGVIVDEVIEPLNSLRPKVPPELKNKAFDPLSFLLRLREHLASALAAKAEGFSLTLFDGRDLTQIDLTIEKNPSIINYKGQKVPVVAVSMKRKPIAGFLESELKDFDSNTPAMYMYFSKDERLVPLYFKSKSWFGSLTGKLVKECRTDESCLQGIK
jgi:hypothetical protein